MKQKRSWKWKLKMYVIKENKRHIKEKIYEVNTFCGGNEQLVVLPEDLA